MAGDRLGRASRYSSSRPKRIYDGLGMPGLRPSRDRSWIILLIIFTIELVVLPIGKTPSALAARTCGNFNRWIYSAYHNPSNVQWIKGANARIRIRQNNLCTGATQDGHPPTSVDWSMLQSGNGVGWAQIGYGKRRGVEGGRLRHFYQTKRNDGFSPITRFFVGNGVSYGTSRIYRVSWWNSDNKIHLIICFSDGTGCVQYRVTSWNPISAGWNESQATWAGETFDNATDMPGLSNDKARSDAIKSRQNSGWYTPSSLTRCTNNATGANTCNDVHSRYHLQFPGGDSGAGIFDLWTDPL